MSACVVILTLAPAGIRDISRVLRAAWVLLWCCASMIITHLALTVWSQVDIPFTLFEWVDRLLLSASTAAV
jgi:hypothetical protein